MNGSKRSRKQEKPTKSIVQSKLPYCCFDEKLSFCLTEGETLSPTERAQTIRFPQLPSHPENFNQTLSSNFF
jgi:hypothetical protein